MNEKEIQELRDYIERKAKDTIIKDPNIIQWTRRMIDDGTPKIEIIKLWCDIFDLWGYSELLKQSILGRIWRYMESV